MNLKLLRSELFKKNRIATVVFIIVLTIIVTLSIQSRYRFAFLTDYSVNFSCGILDQHNKLPVKGEYYAFIFKAVNNEKYGRYFVKKVACISGDLLVRKGRDFYCNDKYIGSAKIFDRNGSPAPLFEYNGVIPQGYYFAVGENIDSYDSKYWGFVNQNWVVGKVHVIM